MQKIRANRVENSLYLLTIFSTTQQTHTLGLAGNHATPHLSLSLTFLSTYIENGGAVEKISRRVACGVENELGEVEVDNGSGNHRVGKDSSMFTRFKPSSHIKYCFGITATDGNHIGHLS